MIIRETIETAVKNKYDVAVCGGGFAGISAACGQFSITKAYTKAPAREISVFDYTQVLFAALLGFLFLEQIPDQLSFLGYAIIIGSAVFKWAYMNRKQECHE